MPDINLSLNPEDPLIKHAFRGASFAVVRLEELNEIVNLKADAVACYRPANSQELFAVERIAVCQQAMLRGYRLEAGLFTTALDYCLEHNDRIFRPMTADLVGDGDIEITRAQNRNFAAAEGFRRMSEESDVWSLLIRYQVNADRQYCRAVEDYERVKRLRPEMPHQPVDPKPENIDDDLASFTDLGYSELDRTPPIAPVAAQSVTPQCVASQPAPAFNPTANIRRAAAPETSRFHFTPVAELAKSSGIRLQPTPITRATGSQPAPAFNPTANIRRAAAPEPSRFHFTPVAELAKPTGIRLQPTPITRATGASVQRGKRHHRSAPVSSVNRDPLASASAHNQPKPPQWSRSFAAAA